MELTAVFLKTGAEKFFENPSYLLGIPLAALGLLGAVFTLVAIRPPPSEAEARAEPSAAVSEEAGAEAAFHLPGPSIWPLVLAVGVVLSLLATVVHFALAVVGLPLLVVALAGWLRQSTREYRHLPEAPRTTEAALPQVAAEAQAFHLPGPSIWPLLLAVGIVLSLLATVVHFALAAVGVPLVVLSLAGWVREALRQHRALPTEESGETLPAKEPARERTGPRAR